MQMTPQFQARLDGWLRDCQALIDRYFAEHYQNLQSPVLTAEPGRTYIKIVSSDRGTHRSRSVWAFVVVANGDILKPATWKAPAKHARGNIFDDARGMGRIGPYGPEYLR